MDDATLHGYYSHQDVLPTHGQWSSDADLAAYEVERRRVLEQRLQLPPRLFRGARLLEFGPDAGENSLVFASWGADCTLVEPNANAHAVIREYFERFGLGERLEALSQASVEDWAARTDAGTYDIVDAEGFVYSIKPTSLWVELFARLLAPGGHLVLFYMEAFGGFFELMLKVIQARVRSLTGEGSTEAAARTFRTKWDSIPHKRAMESWVMDVLENPFVRLEYMLEPVDLCARTDAVGLRLHSSWPRYADGLEVGWFKAARNPGEEAVAREEFLRRSRLSHLFGRRHFLTGPVDGLDARFMALLETADGLIDAFEPDAAAALDDGLAWLASLVAGTEVFSAEGDVRASLDTVASLRRILRALSEGDAEKIVHLCNTEAPFVATWGAPSHFAVFTK